MIPSVHLVKTAGLQAKVKAYQASLPAASRQMLMILGAQVGQNILRTAPRDTNRFIDGWAEAFNAAGLGPLPVYAIRPSKIEGRLIERLEQQVRYLSQLVATVEARAGNRYISKNARRASASEKQARKELRKLNRRLERAQEELAKAKGSESFLVIWGRASGVNRKTGKRQSARLDTVRDRVYGGTGAMVRGPAGWIVAVHNREPHATIVESRTHVYSEAFRSVMSDSVIRSKAKRVGVDLLRRAGSTG